MDGAELIKAGEIIKELDCYECDKYMGSAWLVEQDGSYYHVEKHYNPGQGFFFTCRDLGSDREEAIAEYIDILGMNDPDYNLIEIVGYSEIAHNTKYFIKA